MVFLVPIGGRMFLNSSIPASVFLLLRHVDSMYLTEILALQQARHGACNRCCRSREGKRRFLTFPSISMGRSLFPISPGHYPGRCDFCL